MLAEAGDAHVLVLVTRRGHELCILVQVPAVLAVLAGGAVTGCYTSHVPDAITLVGDIAARYGKEEVIAAIDDRLRCNRNRAILDSEEETDTVLHAG